MTEEKPEVSNLGIPLKVASEECMTVENSYQNTTIPIKDIDFLNETQIMIRVAEYFMTHLECPCDFLSDKLKTYIKSGADVEKVLIVLWEDIKEKKTTNLDIGVLLISNVFSLILSETKGKKFPLWDEIWNNTEGMNRDLYNEPIPVRNCIKFLLI